MFLGVVIGVVLCWVRCGRGVGFNQAWFASRDYVGQVVCFLLCLGGLWNFGFGFVLGFYFM